jgi:hypothetical protein
VTITGGTLLAGGAPSLAADDDSYFEVGTNPFQNAVDWYGTFNSVPLPVAMQVTYTAKASAPCTSTLYLWNWGWTGWTSLDSRALGLSETTATVVISSPGPYVNALGTVKARLRCSRVDFTPFSTSNDVLQLQLS